NVLIKMADPVFLGYHAGSKAEISLKVVKKRHAEEKVGIVGYIDGHLHIIEYSELSQEDMYARNGDGALKYNAGNIAVHVMDIDFLERIYQIVNALPYHAALKKVSCLNEKGDMVNPEKNNAVKFESFIFDILDPQGNVIGLIEISPHFALDEEELRSKIDTQFQFNGLLNL
ncbi:MAG: UDPGP type 1 family protein, partial [Candidatus Jettenia sp.]|nr:UDPGP type 1 family protein [Candidatus Jettenia sp.]